MHIRSRAVLHGMNQNDSSFLVDERHNQGFDRTDIAVQGTSPHAATLGMCKRASE